MAKRQRHMMQRTEKTDGGKSKRRKTSLASLAAAAMMSDQRLKSDIQPVGVDPKTGLTVYDYEIAGFRERGYLAQEVVEKFPGAVSLHETGFLQVHYSLIGGVPQ